MPQFIQKPGETAIDLATTQYPDLQSAANQGFSPVSAPITPETLKPVVPINVVPVNYPPVPGVSDINYTPTPIVATPQETDMQKQINDLMGLNTSIAGEGAYRTSLETANPDLAKQQQTEQDLSSQLSMLQAEAKNIPNQLQLDSQGRGITAGGLAPLSNEALRMNSIKANTVGALLAATQGKITYAQTLIDRAVKAKFDPLRAEQAAKIANLDLLLKSPDMTIAETNRANAQKLIEEQRLASINAQETDHKTIQSIALEAAGNKADAATLQKIQNATTPEEAIQLAQGFTNQNIADQKAAEKASESAKIDNIDQTNKLAQDGYVYVNTPAKRDELKAQGYDILQQADANGVLKTYAKAPAPVKASGGGGNPPVVAPLKQIETNLLQVVGSDGFLNPADYQAAKQDWIQAGGEPSAFDTKFKGRRNPDNQNYPVTKATTAPASSSGIDFNNL